MIVKIDTRLSTTWHQKFERTQKLLLNMQNLFDQMNSKKKNVNAAENPDSDVAKEVFRIVLPVLSFGGGNLLAAGMLCDAISMTCGMAMFKQYGPPSTMLTVTLDDMNNPKFQACMQFCQQFTIPCCC